jgi:hypothetical protein
VLWRDGKQATLAEVVEKRPARIAMEPAADTGGGGGKKRGRAAVAGGTTKAEPPSAAAAASEGEGDGSAAGFDYYVHYLGYDRRLDEWVSLDRVDLVAGPQERPHGHHGHHHHHGHGHGHHHHHHHGHHRGGGGEKGHEKDSAPTATAAASVAAPASNKPGRKRKLMEEASPAVAAPAGPAGAELAPAAGGGAVVGRGGSRGAQAAVEREHEEITRVGLGFGFGVWGWLFGGSGLVSSLP